MNAVTVINSVVLRQAIRQVRANLAGMRQEIQGRRHRADAGTTAVSDVYGADAFVESLASRMNLLDELVKRGDLTDDQVPSWATNAVDHEINVLVHRMIYGHEQASVSVADA